MHSPRATARRVPLHADVMPKRDILAMPFAKTYPAYVTKGEKKGRTKAELARVKQMDKILRSPLLTSA